MGDTAGQEKSGIAGFSWIVTGDENKLDNWNYVLTLKNQFNLVIPSNLTGRYLLVQADDAAGNQSETIKYDLNPGTSTITPIPCPEKTVGDADCNASINLVDFSIWKAGYVNNSGVSADFDKNGEVDLVDFAIWKKGYLGK
jgi:hypothetical protein